MAQDTFHRKTRVPQWSRYIFSEKIICQKDKSQHRKARTGPPGCFKHDKHCQRGYHNFPFRQITARLGNPGIIKQHVAKGPYSQSNQKHVPNRRGISHLLLFFHRGIQQERKYQKEHAVPHTKIHGTHDAYRIYIDLEYRPKCKQNR